MQGFFAGTGERELAPSPRADVIQPRPSGGDLAELTGVGHELKRAAEFPVARGGASAHVEDVGSERGEALDVGAAGGCFYDAVASFILVLKGRQIVVSQGKQSGGGFLLSPAEVHFTGETVDSYIQ